MRIIFMGTPEFAVPSLRALVEAGHQVVAAYTQPPRPGGRRGKEVTLTPIHRAAQEMRIEVRHPASLKDLVAEADFAALDADIAVVAAYGLILPQAVLDMPKHGCLNVHASLLPRWRGAAPIQRAILAGDHVTGVTIMRMEAGLDTGSMLARASTPVDDKNAGELTAELAEIGANLMVEVLANLPAFAGEAQSEREATYAAKIDKAETRINFSRDAEFILRRVRAFAPTPGAWFEFAGERYRILSAHVIGSEGFTGTVLDDKLSIACGHGAIRPTRIQRAGRPVMSAEEFLRGKSIPAGTVIA
jgi:methionyl-tRNA formyltransferase